MYIVFAIAEGELGELFASESWHDNICSACSLIQSLTSQNTEIKYQEVDKVATDCGKWKGKGWDVYFGKTHSDFDRIHGKIQRPVTRISKQDS